MRKLISFISFLPAFICLQNLSAQEDTTKPKYPVPEFENKVYYYNETTGRLKELTNCQLEAITDKGILKDASVLGIKDEKSASRLTKTQKLKFLIRVDDNVDIQKSMTLLKLTQNPKKVRREALTKNMKENAIYFKNKRVAEVKDDSRLTYVYLLTAENLETAEYIWYSGISTCFGVD
jgi:hypothetical protein